MAAKKRGLGRGLDALLGAASGDTNKPNADGSQSASDLRDIPVDLIRRGKYQPRRDMDQEALQELADSIKAQGVMQPIVVRSVGENKFEIIAGERRWRATQLAGLDIIPAMVREVPDEAAIAMALIENIQRENLNPIEEARALQRLQQEFELTQQQVADAVGKSRTTVTNLMRLMALRDDVRTLLEHGDLEMGHARAILGLAGDEQSAAARTVVGKGLSVRQTEALVRNLVAARNKPKPAPKTQDPNIRQLQDELSQKLGARVQIQHTTKGKGKLVLNYNSLDELDGILGHIK
jgi:ParB family chromosome partitioning protein